MMFFPAVLGFIVLGYSIVLIFYFFTGYRAGRMETLGLSFFTGLGTAPILLLFMNIMNKRFSMANISAAVICLLLISFILSAIRRSRQCSVTKKIEHHFAWDKFMKIAAVLIAVQVIWIFCLVSAPVHSHDAVANFALKAKMFYISEGLPEGFFNMGERTVAHPDYPLMLPLDLVWIYEFTGFDDININLIMPVIFCFFLGMFYALLRKDFSGRISLFAVFLLATIPQLGDFASILYADLPFMIFVTISFIYLVKYFDTSGSAELLLSALFMGYSLWIKNESIVFSAAYIITLAAYVIISKRCNMRDAVKNIIIPLAVISFVALPWFAVKAVYAGSNSDIQFSELTTSVVAGHLKEIPMILNLFQQEVFGPKKWNIFWIMFFGILIIKRVSGAKKKNVRLQLLFVSAAVLGYFAGYMATTGHDLYFYVNTTISRFMIHFTGIALYISLFMVYDNIKILRFFRDNGR